MKTFLVKQKFRLGGERFDIKDDRGVVNYQVEGSFFQIPKTFTIYDAYGEQVSEISKEFFWFDTNCFIGLLDSAIIPINIFPELDARSAKAESKLDIAAKKPLSFLAL